MGDISRIVVYREPDGTVHEVASPPISNVPTDLLRSDLGIPDYVDLDSPPLGRAAASIWAAVKAPESLHNVPERNKIDGPLFPLLMGGGAVKMLCPIANARPSPLNRSIHDLDFIVPKNQGGKFVLLLSLLSGVAGTRYHHFLTSSDKRFNAIRAGDRYRIRAVDWPPEGQPSVTWVDVLVDKIEMRHNIPIKEEFPRARSNMYTIGPEKLFVSKCQLISDYDKKDMGLVQQNGLESRVLDYPHFKEDKFIMGMEEKDMLDVCSLLHDRGDAMSLEKLKAELKDQKFLLTVRLNLKNLISRMGWMKKKGLSEEQKNTIGQAGERILAGLPTVDKEWSKPWWNTDVDTPLVT